MWVCLKITALSFASSCFYLSACPLMLHFLYTLTVVLKVISKVSKSSYIAKWFAKILINTLWIVIIWSHLWSRLDGSLPYRKHGKIHWAKFLCFSRFSKLMQKFFYGYIKYLCLIILNNKHFWPRQRESISTKTSMGLKPQTFSPANLSTSMLSIWL